MKCQVLHTVWCNISAEVSGEIWHWSLSGMKELTNQRTRIVSRDGALTVLLAPVPMNSTWTGALCPDAATVSATSWVNLKHNKEGNQTMRHQLMARLRGLRRRVRWNAGLSTKSWSEWWNAVRKKNAGWRVRARPSSGANNEGLTLVDVVFVVCSVGKREGKLHTQPYTYFPWTPSPLLVQVKESS